MSGIRILAFHDLSCTPLVRMLSLGWADISAHAWDYPSVNAKFWIIYRSSADGTTLVTRDGETPMAPGTAYLIPFNTGFARSNRQPTRQLYAYFDVLGIDPTAMPAVIQVPGSARDRWLTQLADAPRQPSPADAARLAALVLRTVTPYADAARSGSAAEQSQVAPALVAMQSDPARAWSLAELAARCACVADTFGRRFRVAHGCTPVQWLRAHRARLAAHRLITTGDSLDAIATAVGFGTRPYLSRVFRSILGTSPSEYRNARKKGDNPIR